MYRESMSLGIMFIENFHVPSDGLCMVLSWGHGNKPSRRKFFF